MLVVQVALPPQLVDVEFIPFLGDLSHAAAAAVAGGKEDAIAVDDRRWNIGRVIGKAIVAVAIAPHESPIVSGERRSALR